MTDELRTRMIEFLPRLRRFAYALTGDLDRGDDLVQETCMRALLRVDQFQEGTRLDSWMFRIAQNLWLDQVRAHRTRGQVVDLAAVTETLSTDGRKVAESRLTLEAVNRAMAKLAPDLQVLVTLVCIDGRSYQEAADTLQIPIGTVMSRLMRARRTLYEALGLEKPHALGATREARRV